MCGYADPGSTPGISTPYAPESPSVAAQGLFLLRVGQGSNCSPLRKRRCAAHTHDQSISEPLRSARPPQLIRQTSSLALAKLLRF